MDHNINIGFACKIITGQEDINIKYIMLRRLNEENIREVIKYNISALAAQIRFLDENDIRLFRLCSDFVPFGSHERMPIDWKKEFESELKSLGGLIKEKRIRLSMHPGQYTVLNSPDSGVVARAKSDILYHCEVLDSLGLDYKSKIVLHIGGIYKDKAGARERFIAEYHSLPTDVKRRLILENDDRHYNSTELLEITGALNCPFVFDAHHEQCYPSGMLLDEIIAKARSTWGDDDGRMKIHYSQQNACKAAGAHSETIEKDEFLKFAAHLKHIPVDLMLEVKDKNISAIKCKKWLKEL